MIFSAYSDRIKTKALQASLPLLENHQDSGVLQLIPKHEEINPTKEELKVEE